MKCMFFPVRLQFHDLSLRNAYLSIYYTCCVYNHYTAHTIDTPSSVRVATARLTILDRLVQYNLPGRTKENEPREKCDPSPKELRNSFSLGREALEIPY